VAGLGAVGQTASQQKEARVRASWATSWRTCPSRLQGKRVRFATRSERIRRQNHWLDYLYNASAAASYCGVRFVEEHRQPKKYLSLSELAASAARRDGRPWLDMHR